MRMCGCPEVLLPSPQRGEGSCEEIAVAAVCDRRSPLSATCGPALTERRYNFFTASQLRGVTDMGSHAERFLRGVDICSTLEGPRLAALTVATKDRGN